MPRRERVLRVFVSGPDDVEKEVKVLRKVVEQLNHTHGRHHAMRFEVLNWRNDVVPALGEDAQAVINNQIGDDYEIFVGILWTRFGTPTPRAGSGTEEEFNKAYSRWKKNPDSIGVMMYFSETRESPSKIIPEQLAAVNRFRSQLKERGIFCSFKNIKEFENLLQGHFANYMYTGLSKARTRKLQPPRAVKKRSSPAISAILEREKVPFRHGQRADFLVRRISKQSKGFKLVISTPKETYWRAGFALAPNDYIHEGRSDVTITQHFLFHVGRGSSAMPLVPTELHYQAYYKDQPVTHTTPFKSGSPLEIDVKLSTNRHRIAISFGDTVYERDIDPGSLQYLYLLAWADQFGPFRVPIDLTLR